LQEAILVPFPAAKITAVQAIIDILKKWLRSLNRKYPKKPVF